MSEPWHRILLPESEVASQPFKRVLLLSIDYNSQVSQTPMLGPAFLVAHARSVPEIRRAVEFEIRQIGTEMSVEKIIELITTRQYDAIGLSCFAWNYGHFQQLIPLLKKLMPGVLLIMGGPQTAGQGKQLLEWNPELDIIVYGGGEVAFAEIVLQLVLGNRDWDRIGGIAYRYNSSLFDTSSRKKHVPFEEIASPYIEGVITGHHPNLYMETQRGCPYSCAYCVDGNKGTKGKDVLSLARIKHEIAIMKDLGSVMLGIFDPNFNQPGHRAEQVFDLIVSNGTFATIGASVYAQTLRESLVAKMARHITILGVGLQSSDVGVNANISRRFHSEKMKRGIELLNRYGLEYTLQIIIGLPGDTYESIVQTLNYTINLRPPGIDAFRLMILPGTEYARRSDELGIIHERYPFHYIISHATMGTEELNRAERMAQALAIFYNRPKTRRELFLQAADAGLTITDYSESIGTFIENFELIDRTELRKGNVVRAINEDQLLTILAEFKKFRKEFINQTRQSQMP